MALKRLAAIASAAIVLGGCVAKLPDAPTAPAAFGTFTTNLQTLEVELINALRTENDTLRVLSRDSYSCGDPRDPYLASLVTISDPAKVVERRFEANVIYDRAADAIEKYAEALKAIQTRDANAAAKIAALQTSLKSFSGSLGFSGAVVDPLASLAGSLRRAMSLRELRETALNMKPQLARIVLELGKNYPTLGGHGGRLQRIFDYWDNCSREKIRYIRDVPIGLVTGYTSYVAQSSGIEISNAYAAYRARRIALRPPTPEAFTKILTDLVKQNDKLALEASEVSLDELARVASNVASAAREADKLMRAN